MDKFVLYRNTVICAQHHVPSRTLDLGYCVKLLDTSGYKRNIILNIKSFWISLPETFFVTSIYCRDKSLFVNVSLRKWIKLYICITKTNSTCLTLWNNWLKISSMTRFCFRNIFWLEESGVWIMIASPRTALDLPVAFGLN